VSTASIEYYYYVKVLLPT